MVLANTIVYPTDPLTVDEIAAIKVAIESDLKFAALGLQALPSPAVTCPLNYDAFVTTQVVYMEVLLKEPEKAFVLAFQANPSITLVRRARVLLYVNNTNATYEAICKLDNSGGVASVESLVKLGFTGYPNNNFVNNADLDTNFGSNSENVNTWLTTDELILICKANSDLMARLRRRNVTDLSINGIYPYPFYTFEALRNFTGCCGAKMCPDLVDLDAPNHRYYPTVFFDPSIATKGICNVPANWGIVEGIFIVVDCTTKSIYRIIEDGPLPPPGADPIVPATACDPYQTIYHKKLEPIYYSQPKVSFDVPADDMHQVTWDNWKFRWSYQRSGLTLYNICYNDRQSEKEENYRSVIYKACVSDTIVVYNVSEPIIARTYISADSHNWPILPRLTTLERGRDVPAYVRDENLYDVVVATGYGDPCPIEKAIAIYEQEEDLLWRVNAGVIKFVWPNNVPPALTGSRKRQLVVRTIFSGFYYLFVYSFVFNQDGTMEYYVDLQGQTTNQWVVADTTGKEEPNGQRYSQQLISLHHTHSCMFRIDFDIDGTKNAVTETNCFRVCDRKLNPCGDNVRVEDITFKKELEGVRNLSIKHNRVWGVESREKKNYLGFPTGYHVYFLGPNGNSTSLCLPDSAAHSHLPYLKNALHVSKYRYGEEYAAGEFPVLNKKVVGLTEYTKENEDIENEDVVCWFNTMFFHDPHTEDNAFISGHRLGVGLYPANFFNFNPANSIQSVTAEAKEPPSPIFCTYTDNFEFKDCSGSC